MAVQPWWCLQDACPLCWLRLSRDFQHESKDDKLKTKTHSSSSPSGNNKVLLLAHLRTNINQVCDTGNGLSPPRLSAIPTSYSSLGWELRASSPCGRVPLSWPFALVGATCTPSDLAGHCKWSNCFCLKSHRNGQQKHGPSCPC